MIVAAVCRFVLFALMVSLVAGGCAGTPPAKLYTLSALKASEQPAPSSPPVHLVLGIGPVTVPDYLDRPQIVTRRGDNEIDVSEFDIWAGSLDQDVARVLAENVSLLLGSERVYAYPWLRGDTLTHRIRVKISHFEGSLGGSVLLRAQWSIVADVSREVVLARESRISEPVGGSDYGSLVAAQSRVVGTLSREIAEAVMSIR